MNKKMMLLALAAVSAAMLAVPALATALPAHLSANPGNFTTHGGASVLTRTAGGGTHGTTTTTVNGKFTSTTGGTMELLFHGVTSSFGACNSSAYAAGSGTVQTTNLTFHLIMLGAHQPGILITSNNKHFVTYNCAGIPVVVNGSGIIGTITSPTCGTASNKATLKFESVSAGHQKHTTYTGKTYDLESNLLGGAFSTSAMDAEATITMPSAPTLNCT